MPLQASLSLACISRISISTPAFCRSFFPTSNQVEIGFLCGLHISNELSKSLSVWCFFNLNCVYLFRSRYFNLSHRFFCYTFIPDALRGNAIAASTDKEWMSQRNKQYTVNVNLFPYFQVNNNNNNDSSSQCNEITEDQTLSAACTLVCEWANKLLGRVFSTLLDLARFLVGGSYVSTKSMAAFVVMSATESKVRKMSEK